MDERLRDLAKASPDFGLPFSHQPLPALYGALAEGNIFSSLAEGNIFSSPNAAQVQAGQFGEVRPRRGAHPPWMRSHRTPLADPLPMASPGRQL